MIRLIYNNKAFRILNEFSINTTNNTVTFNDITIDFTDYDLEDMPLKYQEVKIKQCEDGEDILTDGKVLFFGYVDTIEVGRMKLSQEKRELTITLLSPIKLSTVRTVTLIGTYNVRDIIPLILEPLINDGFEIAEMNVDNGQITVNHILQTIEFCMNNLSVKKNIFWFIDENKKIYINQLDYLFQQTPTKIQNDLRKEGLINIEPNIEATDYANVINIKNARLLYKQYTTTAISGDFDVLKLPKTIKTNDTIEFNYPISFSIDYLKKMQNEGLFESAVLIPVLVLTIGQTNYSVYYNVNTQLLEYTGSFTYSDDDGDEGTIVLQRDNFFSNLITGFKWNGSNAQIRAIDTNTALRYVKVKFINSQEVERLKGIISDSGQIERTIDANETWFTEKSLLEYAKAYLVENKNDINTIKLTYDKNYGFKIGELLAIDFESFYSKGNFAITEIAYSYVNEIEQKWIITAKKSNLLSSYIDLFRGQEDETSSERNESLLISQYITEGVKEIHNVEEVE